METRALFSDRSRRNGAVRSAFIVLTLLGLCVFPRPAARAQGAIITTGSGSSGGTVTTVGTGGTLLVNTNPATGSGSSGGTVTLVGVVLPPSLATTGFFSGEQSMLNGVRYLAFPNGRVFGFFTHLSDTHYIYHYDMGFEYVVDAADGHNGVYLYDFKSDTFFYTSPTFSFPYLYDFKLGAFVYYFPDTNNPGHYNTDGVRYFYNFATREIVTK